MTKRARAISGFSRCEVPGMSERSERVIGFSVQEPRDGTERSGVSA